MLTPEIAIRLDTLTLKELFRVRDLFVELNKFSLADIDILNYVHALIRTYEPIAERG